MAKRFDEDSPFEGMTAYDARGLVGKLLRKSHGNERFKLNRKHEIAEFVEDEALNDANSIETRLQCVGHVLKMESLNFEQEKQQVQVELDMMKIESIDESKDNTGPTMVLLLPPNGSEVTS